MHNLDVPKWMAKSCQKLQCLCTTNDHSQLAPERKTSSKRPRSPLRHNSPRFYSDSQTPSRNEGKQPELLANNTPRQIRMVDNDEDDSEEQLERERKGVRASVEFEDVNFMRFVKLLERLISKGSRHRTENTIDSDSSVDALKMTDNEKMLSEIRENVLIQAENRKLQMVSSDLLSGLLRALALRVRHVTEFVRTVAAEEVNSTIVSQSISAAHCVIIIQTIYAAPKVPRTLLVEELLEDVTTFARLVLDSVIFPAFETLKKPTQSRSSDEYTGLNGNRISASSRMMQKLVSLFGLVCDSFHELVGRRLVPEEFVLQILSVGMRSLRIPDVGVLHVSVVRLAAAVCTHFVSLESQVSNFVLDEIGYLPTNRRQLRTFRVSGVTTMNIRVSSALALQVIQYLVLRGRCRGVNGIDETKDSSFTKFSGLDGVEQANRFAMTLSNRLLSKLFQEKDTEYRTAVQALLDDVMALYIEPDWPGANIFLRRLCFEVVNSLEMHQEKKLNAYARGLGIDYLGKLVSRLSSLFGPQVLTSEKTKDQQFENGSDVLTRNQVTIRRFFQGISVSSVREPVASKLWEALFVGDDLRIANGNSKERNETDVNMNSGDTSSGEIQSDCSEAYAQSRLRERTNALRTSSKFDAPSRESATRAVKAVLRNSGLSRDFPRILDTILFCFQDPTPTVRAKAIRALSQLDFDRRLVFRCLPSVVEAIENCCRDISTLVRDAALDFVGGFLTLEKDLTTDETKHVAEESGDTKLFRRVFELVDKRLKDSAVLVRKRAINIFRKLAVEVLSRKEVQSEISNLELDFSLHPHENLLVIICASLVGRLDDPETSVRVVAEKTIRYSLFGIESNEELNCQVGHESAMRCSRRLVSLFKRLNSSSQTNLFSRILTKSMVTTNKNWLATVVQIIIDMYYDLESRTTNEQMNFKEHLQRTSDMQRVACSSVLCSFCSLDPTLIAPHCTALALHITDVKPSSESDVICLGRILRLLEYGIPHVESVESSFLTRTIGDVESIVCQVPTPELEEPAVRCLCAIALHADTNESHELLLNVAVTFFNFVMNNESSLTALSRGERQPRNTALERNARGAIVRLSLLLRYGRYKDDFVRLVADGLKRICDGMLDVWSEGNGATLGSPVLLRSSIRALINFLIRHRSYLPVGTEIMLRCTATSLRRNSSFGGRDRESLELLLQVLMGFHEMLRNEEERNSSVSKSVASGKEKSNESRKPTHLAAEDDAEAGYLAVCAQSLLPSLSSASSMPVLSVRRCVVNIYGLLIRQGLVLPANVVSPLFLLMVDSDAKIREDSLRVIVFIADRHSGMLASAFLPGVRDCFRTLSSRLSVVDLDNNTADLIASSIVDSKTGFAYLSSALVLLSRDQRLGILEGLLREFDPCLVVKEKCTDETTAVDTEEGEIELHGTKKPCPISLLVFIATFLMHLDYCLGTASVNAGKQMGGSAAADAKLKAGQNEIAEICDVATRIISNSGQAVLRVAVQYSRDSTFSADVRKVADYSTRLSILLQLKSHLRRLRIAGTQQLGEDQESNGVTTRTPLYSMNNLNLTAGALCRDPLFSLPCDEDCAIQIKHFRKLMRDDATEIIGGDIGAVENGLRGFTKRNTKRSKKLKRRDGRIVKRRHREQQVQ